MSLGPLPPLFSASDTPSLRMSGTSSLLLLLVAAAGNVLTRGREDKNAAALVTLFSSFRSFKSSIDRRNFCSRPINYLK